MAVLRVPRSVLIVDDHGGFRAWARTFLETEGFQVVGEAADGAEAISSARRLHPDVMLLDVNLPDMDGFAVAAVIASDPVPCTVVLLSSRERREFGQRVAAAGVRGFISKADLSGSALHALVSGGP